MLNCKQYRILALYSFLSIGIISGCGGGSDTQEQENQLAAATPVPAAASDIALQNLINANNLEAFAADSVDLPSIDSSVAQLGKKLFFAKNLGGEQSVACVSCHHPMLGGADELSLPVGVAPVNQFDHNSHALLGEGRFNGNHANNLPVVPRNAPTVFNIGLNDEVVFWDGRIQRLANGGISTPDSGQNISDTNLPAGISLANAQARFPITSAAEMRGEFETQTDNQTLRSILAGRFDNSNADFQSTWRQEFEPVFGDQNIDFDEIAHALGEYERSMLFVNNAWQAYLLGQNDALTEQQKQGAILFFTPTNQGGAGCSQCHSGTTLSDSEHHLVAFPQLGPGKGNDDGVVTANATSADFGRENISGNQQDRYHFRTPTLLNIATSAPYGHAGAYQTLQEVVRHYINPQNEIDRLFAAQAGLPFSRGSAPVCQLPQFADIIEKNNVTCESLLENAYENSSNAAAHLQQARSGMVQASAILDNNARLNGNEVNQIVAFLEALTDPCVLDRDCMSPWIIDGDDVAEYPDANPLVATDLQGIEL
ncbi:MAG: cytochrome c peroxidase [Patiriisocius sp.]|jgi:cytochrome c peroxidase